MNKMRFSVEINAPKEKVWKTLWDDKTFRDWANNIDEGMYFIGKIEEGTEVQFVSGTPGYGVTSVIEKLTPGEFVLFRHTADTIGDSKQEREKEWTGGEESYSLAQKDGATVLTVELDVPLGQEETFKARQPKALERVKVLAEK